MIRNLHITKLGMLSSDPYMVTIAANNTFPLGFEEVFPNFVSIVEFLKSSDDYENAEWIKGTGTGAATKFEDDDQIEVKLVSRDGLTMTTRINKLATTVRRVYRIKVGEYPDGLEADYPYAYRHYDYKGINENGLRIYNER